MDFRSDTVTKPTEEMRQAMKDALVGDDVYGEDPSVNKLEELAAKMLGKEDALLLTSGTQGNQVALLTHCRPGDEIIVEAESHIFLYEGGGASALAGVQSYPVQGNKGVMDASDVRSAIRGDNIHYPDTSLICLENTHNKSGGRIIPPSRMKEIYDAAKEFDVSVHMDGARLFNAAVASGLPVTEFTQYADTVQVCLSKGLSAPIGCMLAGSEAFIQKARKWRKRVGGGLRQAGIIAAPGMIALEKMVDRLAIDHKHAKMLAEGLAAIPGLSVDVSGVETNIVMCDLKDAGVDSSVFIQKLNEAGIYANPMGSVVRFVTHREITEDMVVKAINEIRIIVENEISTHV